MKKRFDNNPRKRSQTSFTEFRAPNSDDISDMHMMNVKRVKFKDSETKENNPPSCGFDASSVPLPCEAKEPPQSLSDPKTSEFAFFKKLKQDVSNRSCRQNSVERERIHAKKFRTSHNAEDLGNARNKDVKSSFDVKKSTSCDTDSFMTLKGASARESSDKTGKVSDDHDTFKSSFLIRTPTAGDLDSFLKSADNASAKPASHLNDGDIFSSKRLKLRQQIAKTLFPETEQLPKECDLVSLLLRRLLPESSENTLSSPNIREVETRVKSQLHPFPESNALLKDNFLGCGASAAWPQKFNECVSVGQMVEDDDSSGDRGANRKLLRNTRGNEQGSSLTDVGSECWSDKYGNGKLSTLRNEDYEYPTKCLSNRFRDRNLLTWSHDDYAYPTTCNACTDIFKPEIHYRFSYNSVGCDQLCGFGNETHLDRVLNGSYASFATDGALRNRLKYKDEISDCNLDRRAAPNTDGWCNSASDVSCGNSGYSELSDSRGIAAPDYLNDFETRRETCPLLLGWHNGELDSQDLSDTSGREVDIYPTPSYMSGEDHHIADISTSVGMHSASWPCSSLLHLPSYACQDHHNQRHDVGNQNQVIASPRCARYTYLRGLEQAEREGHGFFNNIFRDGGSILPQIHHRFTENMDHERTCPSVETLLLSEGVNSELGVKCKLLRGFSEEPSDFFMDNILQLLRQEDPSPKFVLGNDDNLAIRQREDWSSVSVLPPAAQIYNGQVDNFALQLPSV